MTTVQSWVRMPIHVQLCSTGFPAELRITAFSSRFTRLMCQFARMGKMLSPQHLKGWELHPHENQVIQAVGTSDNPSVHPPV